jgi:two-component system sensor histidine kinase/response regulator
MFTAVPSSDSVIRMGGAEGAPDQSRAEEIFSRQHRAITERVDRSFAVLMCGQYLACIAGALWLSPRAWAGPNSWTHVHVWAAIFLGGLITSLPVAQAILRPGKILTRHVVAVGQMLMSALLIHITGGRIETHFHVFGSLAFLAFYRDARVLATASLVVAMDHFLRGVLWPESVFGDAVVDYWRWLEHTGWVVFEDAFLIVFIKQNLRMLRENAQRSADVEKARDTAERANRAKDEFIAVLSHELRTPLTPALLILSEIAKDPALNEDVRRDVEIVKRNVQLEARLIDDLLDVTRIAAGKLEVRSRPVDVHATISQVIDTFREEFETKQLAVDCRFDAGLPFVKGDSERLQQVFYNLVKNAIKFTNKGGRVALRTSNQEGMIKVEISDTGIGIESEVLSKLFCRFQQGRPEVARLYGGLGLGLSICHALVEKHGGKIHAVSEGPGYGSTFTVELPIGNEIPRPIEIQRPPTRSAPGVDNRILLVEDHDDTREALARDLTRSGYNVTTASTLVSALKKLGESNYDLVISDVGLPDGSGRDLMVALNGQGPRAIAISGFAMESDVRESVECGFVAHFTKPIELERLKQVMANTLQTRER